MKKLLKAQFVMNNGQDFKKVLTAFSCAFPSIRSLPDVAEELINFLFTGEYSPKIQEALDWDSCEGEWPGKVYLVGENSGSGWKATEMIIQPYVGDRVLIVRDFRTAPVWPTIFCEANYVARPSESAANKIIALHNSDEVFRWNTAEFELDESE